MKYKFTGWFFRIYGICEGWGITASTYYSLYSSVKLVNTGEITFYNNSIIWFDGSSYSMKIHFPREFC